MPGAVAARIDSIKAHAGVRSREIAQLLDTTPQTVSRWQQGYVDPQPTKLQQLLALEWLADQLHDFTRPTRLGCGCSAATAFSMATLPPTGSRPESPKTSSP